MSECNTPENNKQIDCRDYSHMMGLPYGSERKNDDMKKLTYKQKNRIFNAVLFALALAAFIFCLLSFL